MRKRWGYAGGLGLVLLAVSASAQTAGSDLQSRMDEAKRQTCGICKKQINEHPKECAVEVAAIAKIDCADLKSYKSDTAKKLNEDCIAKWKVPGNRDTTAVPRSSPKPSVSSPRPKSDEEPKGDVKCRAMDGDQLLFRTASDHLFDCYDALKAKVKALKCTAGVHDFTFKVQFIRGNLDWSPGGPQTVFCEE
jgi:hypothetical protein